MNPGILSKFTLIALLAGTVTVFGGCDSSQKKKAATEPQRQETAAAPKNYNYKLGPRLAATDGQGAPAPAPAPMARETPRPAAHGPCNYSPTAGPGMNISPMAFPTGDVATSAVLVHQVVPAQVRAGSNYTYELHVTNITAGTLQNVVVHNEGAQNLTVVSSDPAAAKGNNGDSMWMLGDLSPCQTKVIKITGKADKVGTSSSCSSVSYNNTLCASTTVVEPALQITKQITAESILGCDPITMTVEVKNSGTGTASNVKISDTLPAGLTTADGKSTVDIAVGDLAQGQSKPFTVALKATKTGKYDNQAKAMADGGLTATSNTVSTVVKQASLALACKVSTDRVIIRPGAEGCFELTLKNTGDGASKGSVVTATVAGGTVSSADGGQVNGANVTWGVGDLAPGASKTVKLCVRPTTMGDVTVSATATGGCASQVATNCKFGATGTPDIGTTVTDADGVVLVGDNHTYQCEVKNQGQVDLTNTKMVVTLPEGLTFVSSPQNPQVAGNKLTFNFGSVAAGQLRSFTFVAKATKSGELLVIGETTCDQLKTPVRDDELTVFIDR